MTENFSDIWVCVDCYFAHHYGATYVTREATPSEEADYFAGHGPDRVHAGITWIETPEGLEVGEWFAGESDSRCESGAPLALLDGLDLSDWTCSSHRYRHDDVRDEDGEYVTPCEHCGSTDDEDGIQDFSWSRCQGCGSNLGGSRHRLAYTRQGEE